jgi:methyl-accepting chemotaxis protein
MSGSFSAMKIKTKLWIITIVALIGVAALSAVALVTLKDRMMEEKRIKTQHLIETAYGVLDYYHKLAQAGGLPEKDAQTSAIAVIKGLRYQEKEYFWINDMQPRMVMHPMRPDLDGKDLTENQDPKGKKLFVEFVNVVKRDKAGFVDYMWPKPGLKDPIPKISYVKGFAPWGWIIGTGIYVDDVDAAFWDMAKMLAGISGLVLLVLTGISYLITISILRQLGAEPAEVAAIVRAVANGDLCVKIDVRGNHESLLAVVQQMVEQLCRIVEDIRTAAESISSGSKDLSASAEEISRHMAGQSERVSQIATSSEEMTQTVEDVARNASHIALSANSTTELARNGGAVVDKSAAEMHSIEQTVNRSAGIMRGLGARSEQIGEIISVINDIADQTNLLALNAAIEAARAGEQGRGFAVVADEVRKLAERTAKATAEIGSMIKSIQGDVGGAVSAMDGVKKQVDEEVAFAVEAGEALQKIVRSVDELHLVIQQVASSTEEMSSVSEGISSDIQAISISSRETTSGADQIARSSSELAGLAGRLKDVVGRFKVK